MVKVIEDIFGILISILVLWKGADVLIENSSKIAKKHNISESIIGLTILAFGTSLPEFLVSLSAALMKSSNISIGNIIGSNIFNLGFVLSISALVSPISIEKDILFRDIPFFILSSVLFAVLTFDHFLSRLDALILLLTFSIFIFLLIKTNASFKGEETFVEEKLKENVTFFTYVSIVLSLIVLSISSKYLVYFAKDLALKLGISDWIIGSTIVAVGTSLPEFVTSLLAAIKGKSSMSIGNILGSNIFNTCLALGCAGLVRPMIVKKEATLGSLLLAFLGIYLVIVGFKYQKLSRLSAFILLLLGILVYYKVVF